MSREYEERLVAIVVPQSEWVVLARAQQVLVALWHLTVSDRVRVTLEEPYLLHLQVSRIEAELRDQLIFRANQKCAVVLRFYSVAAVGDVWTFIRLNGLVLHDVHVVLETDDRCLSLQGRQDDVLIIVKEVTAQDHRFAL